MKRNLYINLIGAAAIIVFLAGCSATTADNGGDKKAQLEKLKNDQAALTKQIQQLEAELAKEDPAAVSSKAKEVSVTEILPRKFDHYVQTQGLVESEENIQVSAKSMGVVTHVFVKEGEMVTRGQTLGQIDNSLIVRGIDEVKGSLELAKTFYERQKNLWDQKIGTEVQFLQAKNNKENLEKRLASLNEQNEMSKIKSPISGVVDEVQLKVGQNIAPGMPAVRVVNNSDLTVKANISEAYSTDVKKGNRVVVSFPDLKKDFQTKVSFAGRNINPLSRTFAIEVDLPSSSELRPSMTAVIKVMYQSFNDAMIVPVNVVQNVNGEKVVYIAKEEGNRMVAHKKVVKVIGVFGGEAHLEGIQAGDKVITFGFQGLNDGEFVKI